MNVVYICTYMQFNAAPKVLIHPHHMMGGLPVQEANSDQVDIDYIPLSAVQGWRRPVQEANSEVAKSLSVQNTLQGWRRPVQEANFDQVDIDYIPLCAVQGQRGPVCTGG